MKSELQVFIEDVESNLGIEITIYDQLGKRIFGGGPEQIHEKFQEIYCDSQRNFSLYRFKFDGNGYILRIEGAGLIINNYAYLIKQLAQKTSIKNTSFSKEEFFLSLLYGKADYYQIDSYIKFFSLEKSIPSCVMILSCNEGRTGEVVEMIKNYTSNKKDIALAINDRQVAFVKFFDDIDSDYRSYKEYADILNQSIFEETGMKTYLTIGSVVDSISKLSQSFLQAAYAQGIRNDMVLSGEVHSFKEYILVRILNDLPKSKLQEYLELLIDENAKEIFEDEEMTATAEEFLENSLNVSETSRKLFLHRNTLIYRLDKIEKVTGLDIRKFSDAVTFRLIKILSKQVNK